MVEADRSRASERIQVTRRPMLITAVSLVADDERRSCSPTTRQAGGNSGSWNSLTAGASRARIRWSAGHASMSACGGTWRAA